MKKRVLSLMLATVMCMALAVTANAVEYDSSISRYYGTGNCSYTAYSALYADGGSRYRAATWVETMNGGNVAAGNMGANGRLYSASGTLLKDTGMMYNTSSYYFQVASISTATGLGGGGSCRMDAASKQGHTFIHSSGSISPLRLRSGLRSR